MSRPMTGLVVSLVLSPGHGVWTIRWPVPRIGWPLAHHREDRLWLFETSMNPASASITGPAGPRLAQEVAVITPHPRSRERDLLRRFRARPRNWGGSKVTTTAGDWGLPNQPDRDLGEGVDARHQFTPAIGAGLRTADSRESTLSAMDGEATRRLRPTHPPTAAMAPGKRGSTSPTRRAARSRGDSPSIPSRRCRCAASSPTRSSPTFPTSRSWTGSNPDVSDGGHRRQPRADGGDPRRQPRAAASARYGAAWDQPALGALQAIESAGRRARHRDHRHSTPTRRRATPSRRAQFRGVGGARISPDGIGPPPPAPPPRRSRACWRARSWCSA